MCISTAYACMYQHMPIYENTYCPNLQHCTSDKGQLTGEKTMNVFRTQSTLSKANREIIHITILNCSVQLQHAKALLPLKKILSMRVSAVTVDSSLAS